jgi:5'-nucleotidase
MAISLNTFVNPHWDTAQHVVREVFSLMQRDGLPEGMLLNVNVPNLPLAALKGMRAVRMGRSRFVETFDRRVDPRGNTYYWMDGEMTLLEAAPDTDVQAVADGYVSLSPLGLDLTRFGDLDRLKDWTIHTE